MPFKARKVFWIILLAVVGMPALAGEAVSVAPEDYQVVDGVAIYAGVMPAQIIRGHADQHEERLMHGGVPAGSDSNHLVIALFDAASGRRIEDALVAAAVAEPDGNLEWKTLGPMRIAGTITYGNYFAIPQTGTYLIHTRINISGRAASIDAVFSHRHMAR